MNKKQAQEYICSRAATIIDVGDRIWEYAETAFTEYKSVEKICSVLEQAGFTIKKGVADIDTAFTATYGSGKPVIGLLAEYDALAGLNQMGGVAEKKPTAPEDAGKPGHGCGHNCIAAGCVGAALGIKAYLEAHPDKGALVVYGCPGEEGGSGKTFMARAGVFDDCDIALTWHPSTFNTVFTGGSLANYQIHYKFYGVAAHAASVPHLGRSALDAVELMNTGVQYLREHMPEKCRIHYAITNSGGFSPNVVQERADVLYLIRSPRSADLEPLYERVNDIAKGAAMMTGTRVEIDFIKACCEQIKNETLEKAIYRNMQEVPLPEHTEEEYTLAQAVKATLEHYIDPFEAAVARCGEEHRAELTELFKNHKGLNDFLLPQFTNENTCAWSTDVGDVTWICPTVQMACLTGAAGTPNHSWQEVTLDNTSIAHKGTIYAAKVLAGTAVDLYENEQLRNEAKAEHLKRLNGATYKCPIPQGVKPRAIDQL